jgi:hypothetical protein
MAGPRFTASRGALGAVCGLALLIVSGAARAASPPVAPLIAARVAREARRASHAFGVRPRVYLFDDGDTPNALAFGGSGGGAAAPVIYVGQNLVAPPGASIESGRIAGILAHELTHVVQDTLHTDLGDLGRELQADCMAGWYLARRGTERRRALRVFVDTAAERSDPPRDARSFAGAGGHGPAAERVRAVRAGARWRRLSFRRAWRRAERLARRLAGQQPADVSG